MPDTGVLGVAGVVGAVLAGEYKVLWRPSRECGLFIELCAGLLKYELLSDDQLSDC